MTVKKSTALEFKRLMFSRSTVRNILPPVAAAMFALSAVADDASAESADESATRERRRRPAVSEIEKDAMEFARAHHPELANLLERMRDNNPRAYRAATLDLSRARERLERLRERAPQRYEHELKMWTMDSRLRLLAARAIRGGKVKELRPQILSGMQERHDFRLNRLRKEKERLAKRMEGVDAIIERLEKHPPSDADIDALLRDESRIRGGRRTKSAAVKPSAESRAGTESKPESPED